MSGAPKDVDPDVVVSRAREAHALVMKNVTLAGQVNIAQAINVHESTVSRCMSREMERCVQVLTAAGLKIVPNDHQTYDRRKIQILMDLARDRINSMTLDQLQVDPPTAKNEKDDGQ